MTKKLTIQIRVEPGCLGPDGKEHIETFCVAAAKIFEAVEPELVSWVLIPPLRQEAAGAGVLSQ